MDNTQNKEIERTGNHLTQNAKKCRPCRFILFFSVFVFLAVLIFVFLVGQKSSNERLQPIPPELMPPLSPEEYERGLLRVEEIFHTESSSTQTNATKESSSAPELPVEKSTVL